MELDLFFNPYDIIEIQLKERRVIFSSWDESKDIYLELYLSEESKSRKKPDYSFDYSDNLRQIVLLSDKYFLRLTNECDKNAYFGIDIDHSYNDDINETFVYGYDDSKGKFKLAIGFIIAIYLFLVYSSYCFYFLEKWLNMK